MTFMHKSALALSAMLALTAAIGNPVAPSYAAGGDPFIVNAPDGPKPPLRTAIVDAAEYHQDKVVVHVQNVSAVPDAELVELVVMEVRELLDDSGFTGDRGVIIQCPLVCGEQPAPPPKKKKGRAVTVKVNAPDGPMPTTRAALEGAFSGGYRRAIIHVENTAGMNPQLVELVIMELDELLVHSGFGPENSAIIQCAGSC